MPTGSDLVRLAETRLGQRYVNVNVPKNNPNWQGPWDCAEFVSWVVFQITGKLFGCLKNSAPPAEANAYSGSWGRDVKKGLLKKTTLSEAIDTPGVVLIRIPPLGQQMGHVALSDGLGGTVEAAGGGRGLCKRKVQDNVWDFFAKIPGITYAGTGHVEPMVSQPIVIRLEAPMVTSPKVREIQEALKQRGFDPGAIDGKYGPQTVAAVAAFQTTSGLVTDGMVGTRTANELGLIWP